MSCVFKLGIAVHLQKLPDVYAVGVAVGREVVHEVFYFLRIVKNNIAVLVANLLED